MTTPTTSRFGQEQPQHCYVPYVRASAALQLMLLGEMHPAEALALAQHAGNELHQAAADQRQGISQLLPHMQRQQQPPMACLPDEGLFGTFLPQPVDSLPTAAAYWLACRCTDAGLVLWGLHLLPPADHMPHVLYALCALGRGDVQTAAATAATLISQLADLPKKGKIHDTLAWLAAICTAVDEWAEAALDTGTTHAGGAGIAADVSGLVDSMLACQVVLHTMRSATSSDPSAADCRELAAALVELQAGSDAALRALCARAASASPHVAAVHKLALAALLYGSGACEYSLLPDEQLYPLLDAAGVVFRHALDGVPLRHAPGGWPQLMELCVGLVLNRCTDPWVTPSDAKTSSSILRMADAYNPEVVGEIIRKSDRCLATSRAVHKFLARMGVADCPHASGGTELPATGPSAVRAALHAPSDRAINALLTAADWLSKCGGSKAAAMCRRHLAAALLRRGEVEAACQQLQPLCCPSASAPYELWALLQPTLDACAQSNDAHALDAVAATATQARGLGAEFKWQLWDMQSEKGGASSPDMPQPTLPPLVALAQTAASGYSISGPDDDGRWLALACRCGHKEFAVSAARKLLDSFNDGAAVRAYCNGVWLLMQRQLAALFCCCEAPASQPALQRGAHMPGVLGRAPDGARWSVGLSAQHLTTLHVACLLLDKQLIEGIAGRPAAEQPGELLWQVALKALSEHGAEAHDAAAKDQALLLAPLLVAGLYRWQLPVTVQLAASCPDAATMVAALFSGAAWHVAAPPGGPDAATHRYMLLMHGLMLPRLAALERMAPAGSGPDPPGVGGDCAAAPGVHVHAREQAGEVQQQHQQEVLLSSDQVLMAAAQCMALAVGGGRHAPAVQQVQAAMAAVRLCGARWQRQPQLAGEVIRQLGAAPHALPGVVSEVRRLAGIA